MWHEKKNVQKYLVSSTSVTPECNREKIIVILLFLLSILLFRRGDFRFHKNIHWNTIQNRSVHISNLRTNLHQYQYSHFTNQQDINHHIALRLIHLHIEDNIAIPTTTCNCYKHSHFSKHIAQWWFISTIEDKQWFTHPSNQSRNKPSRTEQQRERNSRVPSCSVPRRRMSMPIPGVPPGSRNIERALPYRFPTPCSDRHRKSSSWQTNESPMNVISSFTPALWAEFENEPWWRAMTQAVRKPNGV